MLIGIAVGAAVGFYRSDRSIIGTLSGVLIGGALGAVAEIALAVIINSRREIDYNPHQEPLTRGVYTGGLYTAAMCTEHPGSPTGGCDYLVNSEIQSLLQEKGLAQYRSSF